MDISKVGTLAFVCCLASISHATGFNLDPLRQHRHQQWVASKSYMISLGRDGHLHEIQGENRRSPLPSRRDFIAGAAATAASVATVPPTIAMETVESALENGLLESRVLENVLSPPPYGMEGKDIFYPRWFLGSWKVTSTTASVEAPCGVALFGGNATFDNAKKDIGNVLIYESRFRRDESDNVVADREYNVKSIAEVAMGKGAVVDVSLSTPNKFSCLLAPKGSPSMLTVDLIVLLRRQEAVSGSQFHCSEVVREIASPVDKPRQQPALLKEIETASLYTYLPETDEVHCRQRSASFLLPSNDNPMAMRMWQASRGRAIDVRYYDVVYTRA